MVRFTLVLFVALVIDGVDVVSRQVVSARDVAEQLQPIAAVTQTRGSAPSSPSKFPVKRDFQHHYSIESKYDRFENKTTISVTLDPPVDGKHGKSPIELEVSADHAGQRLTTAPPSTVNISATPNPYVVEGLAERLMHAAAPLGLRMLANGRRVPLHQTLVDRSTGLIFDTLPISSFLSMIAATKIEGRAFDFEFTLTDEQREALQDFGSRLRPLR